MLLLFPQLTLHGCGTAAGAVLGKQIDVRDQAIREVDQDQVSQCSNYVVMRITTVAHEVTL